MTVNFGVGWLKEEFDILGVDFHKRGAMSEEYVRAMIELWTSDNPEFEGEFVSFKDIAFAPRPVQEGGIPIWFGGDADAALKRTGRYGSGWMPFLTPPDKIAERLDFIRSQPDYGGKLNDVSYSLSTGAIGEGHVVVETNWPRAASRSSRTLDELGWLASLGVTWSGVSSPPLTSLQGWKDHVQYVAEEIIPAVRDL